VSTSGRIRFKSIFSKTLDTMGRMLCMFIYFLYIMHLLYYVLYTLHTQNNGAVSEVETNIFLTLHGHNMHCRQRKLSKFLTRYQQKTLFLCGASFLNCTRNSRCTVITDLDTSKRSTQEAFSCCDTILDTGPAAPAVSMRSESLVVHERHGQISLLTVNVASE
jgi:hypothetical protein